MDKDALLEAFDSEIELVEAQAKSESGAASVAHSEDVTVWAGAMTKGRSLTIPPNYTCFYLYLRQKSTY